MRRKPSLDVIQDQEIPTEGGRRRGAVEPAKETMQLLNLEGGKLLISCPIRGGGGEDGTIGSRIHEGKEVGGSMDDSSLKTSTCTMLFCSWTTKVLHYRKQGVVDDKV